MRTKFMLATVVETYEPGHLVVLTD